MSNIWAVALGIGLLGLVAFCVWRAAVSARTPQGAMGWAIFLMAAPWIALPAYLILGQHKLRGQHASYRRTLELTNQSRVPDEPRSQTVAGADRLHLFSRLADLPVQRGNAAELLIDGDAFTKIFEAIDSAEHYVLAQFYIITDDNLGNALADKLIAAAKRGVAVRLVCDRVGSYGLSVAYRRKLREGGVSFCLTRIGGLRAALTLINFRNHRKTVIVDGQWASVGGHNIADPYLGSDPAMGHWRDTDLALRGPIVSQLQIGFVQDWHWNTGELLSDCLEWAPQPVTSGIDAVTVLMGPTDEHDTGALFYFSAITQAQRRIWITSPYFVPDIDTLSALKCAALRGCDVRILIPAKIDHYLPWLAAFAFFDEIRKAGVRIYRYRDGFMHQKVVLIDDDLSSVGTANLDNRSFRLNFETMIIINNRGFAGLTEEMLQDDFGNAEVLECNLDEQRLLIRIGAVIARLFSPVL